MKKYSKPVVKACDIRMAAILAGSGDPTLKNSVTTASQLSNERNDFFGEDEEASW